MGEKILALIGHSRFESKHAVVEYRWLPLSQSFFLCHLFCGHFHT